MDTCPKCNHKLLVHSSPRCSWCGALIEDDAYQQEASKKREDYFNADRQAQAAELVDIEAIGTNPELHTVTTFLGREVSPKRHTPPPSTEPLDSDQSDESGAGEDRGA